jgi:hypothetical protein
MSPPIQKENRKTSRVRLDKPLKVVMGSIGSNVRYELVTSNLSVNGFFLGFEKPGRFPFTPSSIMEVWLEIKEGSTLFFNGKMARVVYPDAVTDEMGPGIAIKIIQIDRSTDEKLRGFIEENTSHQGAA